MGEIYSVSEISNKISEAASKYGIHKAYLFGSYARGKAENDSDIDICIEKGKLRTLFELSGFCHDLEEILEKKVDIFTMNSLSADFKKQIENDLVLIYG